jgi:hypothetical protein
MAPSVAAIHGPFGPLRPTRQYGRLAAVRYLVVIPGIRQRDEARFRNLDTDDELTIGDELIVDDMLVRVRAAVDVPADDSHDATLVCTPDYNAQPYPTGA